ncbi:hypothetical protein [Streptomyces sp. NPDC088752]|uniref:hypothetical protein n=1 Tax=Streptomyces sp. NPDC088752 TaxID=3154963 RepID=UPI00342506E7
MTATPSPLRAALIHVGAHEKRIEPEPVAADRIGERPQAGVPAFRRELRLLLQAVVDMRLAEQHQPFTHELVRVPWANSHARAVQVSNLFMRIADWELANHGPAVGEEVASGWESAARLAEILCEDYNGWQHDTYEDIATTFFSAANGLDEQIFRKLLADLNGSTKRPAGVTL